MGTGTVFGGTALLAALQAESRRRINASSHPGLWRALLASVATGSESSLKALPLELRGV